MKTFTEYNEAAAKTDLEFPNSNELFYLALGLSGETGEVSDHIKKHIRDDNGKLTPKRRELILKECGDILWYLNKLANQLNSSLGEVAEMNIKKLASRHKRNQIHGSGDER